MTDYVKTLNVVRNNVRLYNLNDDRQKHMDYYRHYDRNWEA